MKSAKDKAMGLMAKGMIDPYQKAEHRVSMYLNVEVKKVDGKKVVSARMDGMGGYGMVCGTTKGNKPPERPLAEEYTDIDAFASHVADCIRKVGKELLK